MRRAAALVALLALTTLLAGCSVLTDGLGADPAGNATPTVEHEPSPNPASDELGWENGYWYDDPVNVTTADGLNASEREVVVARAMARVERIRGLEFEATVPVEVRSRENYSRNRAGANGSRPALAAFDNAKFEALFLVGEDEGSLDVQDASRNRTVQGYFSPEEDAIVLVSESETPTFEGERTLAHELVHALQDQHFDLSGTPSTRDAYNGRNGLLEGDATAVQQAYMSNCGVNWSCLPAPETERDGAGGAADATPPNFGVYFLEYFPYAEGPGLIDHLRDGGNWSAVDDAFANPPTSSMSVMAPEKYGSFEPREVSLESDPRGGWEQVRPEGRPAYATPGPSAIASSFAYTLYDDQNQSSVISPDAFLNFEGQTLNESDPLDYHIPAVRGWTGGRMHVYERGDDLAYVWRLTWDSPDAAERFAERYRALLSHYGAGHADGSTWRIDDGPYADAFSLHVDGDQVTIANAPELGDLSDVYAGAR